MSGLVLVAAAVACAALSPAPPTSLAARARRPRGRHVLTSALLRLGRSLGRFAPGLARAAPGSLSHRLVERAGSPGALREAEVPALRLGAACAFGLAGTLALVAAPGLAGAVLGLLAAVFGVGYPELWLRSLARRRADAIERAAPLALDLVAATVAAGVPLERALDGAAQAAGGPLHEELELVRANLALGRPRVEEMRDLGERTGSPALAGLAATVALSDRLGVPLAEALRAQATRVRAERVRAIQERAATAAPKILGVVVFVLVPAALLPLLAALGLTIAGAVHF